MKDKPKIPVYKIKFTRDHILIFKNKSKVIIIPKTPINHIITKDFIFVFTDKVTFFAKKAVIPKKISQPYGTLTFIKKYGKRIDCKEPYFGYNVPSPEKPRNNDTKNEK